MKMLSKILLYLSLITIVTFLTNGITTNLFTNNVFAQTQQNQMQQQQQQQGQIISTSQQSNVFNSTRPI